MIIFIRHIFLREPVTKSHVKEWIKTINSIQERFSFNNATFAFLDRIASSIRTWLSHGDGEPEELREAVLRAAQRFTAFRVGKATCYAISKRLAEDWTMDDLDRATSPESLSLAADDYRQSINAARKWIRIELKAGSVEQEAEEPAE